jgi:hypothetical protein
MLRTSVRALVVAALAFVAMSKPREVEASIAMACNQPSPQHYCDDQGYIEYMCDYLCPGWTLATCDEAGTITCSKDPD